MYFELFSIAISNSNSINAGTVRYNKRCHEFSNFRIYFFNWLVLYYQNSGILLRNRQLLCISPNLRALMLQQNNIYNCNHNNNNNNRLEVINLFCVNTTLVISDRTEQMRSHCRHFGILCYKLKIFLGETKSKVSEKSVIQLTTVQHY